MNLPGGLNEATLIAALAVVIGVVAYAFVGGMLPAFTYSQYVYPIFGVGIVAIGMHMDGAIGDVGVGFGAGLAASTLKGLIPTSVP